MPAKAGNPVVNAGAERQAWWLLDSRLRGNDTRWGRLPSITVSLPGLTGQSSNRQTLPVRERVYYVYIIASRLGGTLYIGVTGDLVRRVYQHREKLVKGFTEKYGVDRLVYYEGFGDVGAAIQREKQLKRWNRAWKIKLIEEKNPNWDDLYPIIAIP